MGIVVADYASAMKDLLSTGAQALGLDGFDALPVSSENLGLAQAITDELAAATVSHAIVSGVAPSTGGPLQNGAAAAGVIAGMSPVNLAKNIGDAMGGFATLPATGQAKVTAMATAIATHIMTLGQVVFAPGTIEGTCTNTATSAGTFTSDESTGGKIIGLAGPILADLMVDLTVAPAVNPMLLGLCNGICNYLLTNAEVAYAAGDCTGTAPIGGGPIVAVGTGGKIS